MICVGRVCVAIQNNSDLSATIIHNALEAALTQVEKDVRPRWPIRSGGYTLHLSSGFGPSYHAGYNLFVSTGAAPDHALKGTGGMWRSWSVVLSHELIEGAVNFEICDPVEANVYEVSGIKVSDFILPSWYNSNANGPYDHLNVLTHPGQIAPGGY